MAAAPSRKAAVLAAALWLCAPGGAPALELQVMIGATLFDGLPLPQAEVSLLTSPASSGFQQEIGLRLRSLLLMFNTFEVVARSWLSFPGSGNDFVKERLRVGLEVSPNILVAMPMDWPADFFGFLELAVCSTLALGEPAASPGYALFFSSGARVAGRKYGWDNRLHRYPIWPSLGFLTCWQEQ
jgi:hypothetical protein